MNLDYSLGTTWLEREKLRTINGGGQWLRKCNCEGNNGDDYGDDYDDDDDDDYANDSEAVDRDPLRKHTN